MSRLFAPAPPQAAAQTPAGPKCPAVANGSPGKKMEACVFPSRALSFTDLSLFNMIH